MTDLQKFHFMPQAVVESRWKEQKYVPEVMTMDGNFILSEPLSTHEAAMKVAQDFADMLIIAMQGKCREYTKNLKKARA